MADLLAKQEHKSVALSRGQEVEGQVVAILAHEIILDLGTKAEGVLPKKDLPQELLSKMSVGDKLKAFVIYVENESGQVVLGLQRAVGKIGGNNRFQRLEEAKRSGEVMVGKGVEVNKGGIVVEAAGVKGFLPASQVRLSLAANLEELVGKELHITVIEVDPSQNKLIFSQKNSLNEDEKKLLQEIKEGQTVKVIVQDILPFGIYAKLENGVEGLVHISEIAWEKVENPAEKFQKGDEVEAKVISVDQSLGRVNLSIKQLGVDPFEASVKELSPDDVVKGEVTRSTPAGVFVMLKNNIEGLIPTSKMDPDTNYAPGEQLTCLVDSIDVQKRRVNLAPFRTSTKDLIYK